MEKMFTYWMGKSFWLIHGSGCTVCELRQSVQLSQHIFNPEVKNICFKDKNEELPSHGIHVNTPWKIRFPSQTPKSCCFTVYVLSLSLLKPWRNTPCHVDIYVLCLDEVEECAGWHASAEQFLRTIGTLSPLLQPSIWLKENSFLFLLQIVYCLCLWT